MTAGSTLQLDGCFVQPMKNTNITLHIQNTTQLPQKFFGKQRRCVRSGSWQNRSMHNYSTPTQGEWYLCNLSSLKSPGIPKTKLIDFSPSNDSQTLGSKLILNPFGLVSYRQYPEPHTHSNLRCLRQSEKLRKMRLLKPPSQQLSVLVVHRK